jgi:hypothetical protein
MGAKIHTRRLEKNTLLYFKQFANTRTRKKAASIIELLTASGM